MLLLKILAIILLILVGMEIGDIFGKACVFELFHRFNSELYDGLIETYTEDIDDLNAYEKFKIKVVINISKKLIED